jgi:hypothetical protein
MSFPFFTPPTVYLLDTSSLVRLDGLDGIPPPDPFSAKERALIWDGLEELADEGRIKLIKQVKSELKRHNPKGLARLSQYRGHRLIVRRTPEVIKIYRSVTANHPDLMKGGSRLDPADPWLIVAAEKFAYTIICEELLKAHRAPTLPLRRRKMDRIPDVCQARKLENAVRLRDLAKNLKWIK